MCPFFKGSLKSGSQLPHSEGLASLKSYAALGETPALNILLRSDCTIGRLVSKGELFSCQMLKGSSLAVW